MTREAEHFITPLTLSTLAGGKVYRDMFDPFDDAWKMPHIALAREADVFLIAPATAAIIGKMAYGIADNLLTCLALATKAPILMAPAMNAEMYKNKIVQDNCQKLKEQGVEFVDPIYGKLACGMIGEGHLADIEMIVRSAERASR
jgi:phosphopantothenoylcysteine decarboxylase/phosphopantothenate--cysteine ligase